MPIRSPRKIYEILTVTANVDDDPLKIDSPIDEGANTDTPILVKMKKGIGDFLGLEPISWNDSRFYGQFTLDGQEGATNKGATFHRKIGGFKVASYKLLPVTTFAIQEDYYDRASDQRIQAIKKFQSMSIGFPRGHKVWQIKFWLAAQKNFDQIRAFVTPNGHKIDLTDD